MNRKVSVIGLGYVGFPVAAAFAKKSPVIAFDINADRIAALKKGVDITNEVPPEGFSDLNILFTSNAADLAQADFHIIAVPTPIDDVNKPDLKPLLSASELVGKHLKVGDIVVYESTVYPGATEDDCVPVLENASGLKCGKDFYVGYSPERINPGDKEHTFTKILKIVSGQNAETLDIVADVYASVVEAGVYRASSIKVAEAAKVIENAQRDINIAFVNELSKIFHLLDIDTKEVLEAAGTKWNFVNFKPGLVGGHCIGVDPYYLTYKAEKLGYHPQVLLAGRRINDGMGKYIASQIIKKIIRAGIKVNGAKILVLGLTFKENCPDIRNSKVFDILNELVDFQVSLSVHDPLADYNEVLLKEGFQPKGWDEIKAEKYNAVVLAVPHEEYLNEALPKSDLLFDIKSIMEKSESEFRL